MHSFVQTADAVGKTTKKLQKLLLISAFLKSISPQDAVMAARFLSAKAFPSYDERTLGVGGVTLSRVIARAAGRPNDNLNEVYRRHGDLGDVAEELLREPPTHGEISIAEVQHLFDGLAAASGQGQKAELLLSAFGRASAGDVKYIVKIITGDLRIGSKESLVEEAIAKAFDKPLEKVRRANMLIGDIGETLALASADRLDQAEIRLLHPLGFMLAAPVERAADLFAPEEPTQSKVWFLVEEKYDGIRAQIHKSKQGNVRIFSRTLDEVTEFPELILPAKDLPGELILDGEIVGWRDTRPLPFTELQKRLGLKQIDMFLQADIPVIFAAFDLLFQDSRLLLDEPLNVRKTRLELVLRGTSSMLRATVPLRCRSVEEVQTAFRKALAAGHEGIVAKREDSPYMPGRRGGYWFKLKEAFATLDVVVTGVEYGHGRRHAVLSDYTFAIRDGDRLLNVGKAYSGLTDAEIVRYTAFFRSHTLEDRGHFRTVEPLVVLEVAFNNIQKSSRHASGYALRFPRIVRIRTDKSSADVDSLARVAELFERQAQGTVSGK